MGWLTLVLSLSAALPVRLPVSAPRPVSTEESRLLNELGRAYYLQNQPERAVAVFETMLAADGGSLQALVNLGHSLNAAGRHGEAERYARRAVQRDQVDPRARYLLGLTLLILRKNPEEALAHLGAAADEYPSARLERSRLLIDRGEFDEAMRELERFSRASKLAAAAPAPDQLLAK